MNSAEVAALEEIRYLIASYPMASDRHEVEELAALFTEDGVLDAPTQMLVGRTGIIRGLSESRVKWRTSQVAFVRHHMTTMWIELTNETEAVGRIYWLVVTQNGLDRGGTYSDEYQLVDGQWLIKYRCVQLDYVTTNTTLLPPPELGHRSRPALPLKPGRRPGPVTR